MSSHPLEGVLGTPSRGRLRAAIPRRRKVGPLTALLLAVGFALAVMPIARVDLWLASGGGLAVVPGEPAPVTVRVPPFAGGDAGAGGAVVIARGEIADPTTAFAVAQVRARSPHGVFGDLAYFAVLLALTYIYTLQLRRSNKGRFLRTQLVLLGVLAVAAVVTKALLLLTAISVLAVPVALLALVAALALDRESGIATGVLASVVVSLLVPFDVGVTAILLVQALTASLLLPDRIRRKARVAVWAGLGAAVTGALAYGVVHYLTRGTAPLDELGRVDASSWVAAGIGGLVAAAATMPLVPALQVACGEITDGALIALEDLSHPLLRQIAEKAPGTWQHSLAMANMAEIAANAIGANGRLVRVGAYFHDLGKSLTPKYFIENVESGEQSPHDRLEPEASCDAIFGHVTEGIAVARRAKLPERIIDFMHMHHGDGVLEYFWAKCQDQGNPNRLTSEDFRYPGVPPQSRETAILAICDAVEAASRTLRRPDQQAISSLVQRIVYGKLHLGQLDESGLSMADLRKINDSLRETIKHAHHGRIEYPWQREQREAEARLAQATVSERPPGDSITQKMEEPRLDSLDAPRPPWAAGAPPRGRRPSGEAEAPTVPVTPAAATPTTGETRSLRPSTALLADSVDVAHAATGQAPRITPEPIPAQAAPVDEPAPAPAPAPRPRADSKTPWGARIADRIDALLESEPEEPAQVDRPQAMIVEDSGAVPVEAAPDTTARRQPPPPPRARRPHTTEEVGGDDIEATIEVAPAPSNGGGNGAISGPPPATRAAPRAETDYALPIDDGEDDDEDVTIVPTRPPSSMLPPRARK